ncbi:hypothetical protein BJX63DRAFT_426961 [Aspergillus granulosus]|uniref:Uncharacterized protein n=1 Tax=Aspergillus granulosus TaxID=176169 RepID=A0ABR4I601_9EURO
MALGSLLILTTLVSLVAFILSTRRRPRETKEPITVPGHPIYGHLAGMIRHEKVLTTAAVTSLYGKENPLVVNPSLVKNYWLYDSQMTLFLLNFLPKYTVPEAFKARERLISCAGEARLLAEYGCSDDYLGQSEVELLNSLLSNMVPTVFWMLVHFILDSALADRVNAEVNNFVQKTEPNMLSFAPGEIRKGCPVLVATYRKHYVYTRPPPEHTR